MPPMALFEPWERDLLDELRVARLATVAADGRPHLVPVCYAFVDGTVVVPIDEKPKRSTRLERMLNIERDPRVTLLFDRYHEDWTRLAWVRVDGTARVLARGDQFARALDALRARYKQYAEMALEERPLIVVEMDGARSWRWSR